MKLHDSMKQGQRFQYIGETPAHGKIYKKGNSELVIYSNGEKKYWPDFNNSWENMWKRNKGGMIRY